MSSMSKADAATEVLLGREVLEIPEIIYDQEGERIAVPNVTTDAENGVKLLNPDDPASMIQAFIVMVGIIPIVDCFLIFGVIQQGLLRRMGFWRGICFAALFWMLLRPVPLMGGNTVPCRKYRNTRTRRPARVGARRDPLRDRAHAARRRLGGRAVHCPRDT